MLADVALDAADDALPGLDNDDDASTVISVSFLLFLSLAFHFT